ncbi:MAG: hypothetical protein ABDH18_01105 [Aquificaceae bacterium]
MKEQIKQAFEITPPSVLGATLKKIHKERVSRWKKLSLALVASNLLMVFVFIYPKDEYKPMSAGIEVKIQKDVKFGELEKFLKDNSLTISGPSQSGSFLIEGNLSQKQLEELIKSQRGLTPEGL